MRYYRINSFVSYMMPKAILKYVMVVLVALSTLASCTKPVDFNQVNDLQLNPVFESSLVYINEPANRFLVNETEVTVLQDSVNIDFFNDQFIIDNLVRADLLFQTINSIPRGFQVRVDMMDNSNQILHTFSFSTGASPDNSDLVTEHTEVFQGSSMVALKNTTKMMFTLTLLPGPAIDANTLGRIILKSKGTFYLNVQP